MEEGGLATYRVAIVQNQHLAVLSEVISSVPHNERLEFLGDAMVEFLTTVHLYLMFPGLED